MMKLWKFFDGEISFDILFEEISGRYPGSGRYCTSTLASWTLLMLVMKALIGNIHSSNHAHHPTHKTPAKSPSILQHKFFTSRGTSREDETLQHHITRTPSRSG